MIEFRDAKKAKIKNITLITGLPGVGLIGKLCVDHLIKELRAKKLADIYSDDFPPQIIINDDTSIRLLKNEFYYAKVKSQDIVFLAGDSQTVSVAGSYELVNKIIDFLSKYKIRSVITLGGIATGELKKEPNIYGAFTDEKLKKKFQRVGVIFNRKTNSIIGAAGLFLGIGDLHSISSVCLMGETHGNYIDANAAKVMTNILAKFLGKKVDLKSLDKKAKEINDAIENLQKMQEQQKQQMNPPINREDTMHYIR